MWSDVERTEYECAHTTAELRNLITESTYYAGIVLNAFAYLLYYVHFNDGIISAPLHVHVGVRSFSVCIHVHVSWKIPKFHTTGCALKELGLVSKQWFGN